MNDHTITNGHSNGNGNGNGNGHGIFGLTPKQDPMVYKLAPKARREVIFDTSISEGARMLYCLINDCSLWEGVNKRPGVVRFSNSYLTKKLNVCEKTIQNWKRELVATGRIWLTRQRMKNSFPMTVYNVTALLPTETPMLFNQEAEDGSLPEEHEVLTNRRAPSCTSRNLKGEWVGGSKTEKSPKTSDSSQIVQEKEHERKILPSATATDCRPPTQPIAAHGGNTLPVWAETDCRGERQPIAVAGGNTLPPTAATDCRGGRQQLAGNRESRSRRLEPSRDLGADFPPPSRKKWLQKIEKLFPRELEELKAKLLAQQRQVDPAELALVADISLRIEAIDEQLLGGKPVSRPVTAKPRPARKAVEPAQPTPEELKAGAEYLLSIGKPEKLTAAQKALLAK